MEMRRLGMSGPPVSLLGFGAFKIGRNQGAKYGVAYDLPDMPAVERLLNQVLDAGVNYIDTAPAYGSSEERIGAALSHRRQEFVLSTKAGETFDAAGSRYDFSSDAIRRSVESSLQRLKTDVLDVVYLHSYGDDRQALHESDAVPTLLRLKEQGLVRQVGLSGKTAAGAEAALAWADVLMIEYHLDDRSHELVMAAAAERGIGVAVKKPLASGRLPAAQALKFAASHPAVSTMIVGTLNIEHLRANIAALGASAA